MDSKFTLLLQKIEDEARREDFPIDRPVYTKCGKDPLIPILFAGNPAQKICFFARDLGKDEVVAGQPLYGAAGRLVRNGVFKAIYHEDPKTPTDLEKILESILFTNTVPYKPLGNKAYSQKIKERFRPFLLDFFINYFQGNIIISLGTEAFKWFSPFSKEIEDFWKKDNRYEEEIPITLKLNQQQKVIFLRPLPHPSPLNQTWYDKFPGLLEKRLKIIF
ncbi:MAG: uracil-DNA glycosylase family protein [Planctomycetota bacterium]